MAFLAAALAMLATGPWQPLHRPLHLPHVAPGQACPVSPVDHRVDWKSANIFGGSGTGRGPVYPGLGSEGLVTTHGNASRGWYGGKVFWYALPSYRGRVLIRGARLDGAGSLRFETTRRRELRISPHDTVSWEGQPDGSRGVPSTVLMRAAGCYGVQIDGTTFSRTVVFRVELG